MTEAFAAKCEGMVEPQRANTIAICARVIPLLSLLAASAAAQEYGQMEVVDKLTVKGGISISTAASGAPLLFASSTTSQGRVGIGTTSPATELDVAGGTVTASEILCPGCTAMQVRVTGSCAVGTVIRQINQDGSVACETGTPPSVIVLSTSTCPTGFQELTSFSGRLIKGMPAGGTIAGTLGTPLTDLQSPAHNHAPTPTAENTGLTNLAHTHDFDAPSTASGGPSSTTDPARDYRQQASDTCGPTSGTTSHTHALDPANTTSGAASIGAAMNHQHTFTPGGTFSTVEYPYIQVRVCMKI